MAKQILSPADLLVEAESRSRRLTSHERRTVIAYLEQQGDCRIASNLSLAALFQVDEKMIRKDKKALLEDFTKQIGPHQAMVYVAKYIKAHDDLIRRTMDGLLKCNPGTLGHQNYLRLLSDLESKRMKLLQEIGAVPKELGTLHVAEERWVATVSDDGVAEVVADNRALPPVMDGTYTVQ